MLVLFWAVLVNTFYGIWLYQSYMRELAAKRHKVLPYDAEKDVPYVQEKKVEGVQSNPSVSGPSAAPKDLEAPDQQAMPTAPASNVLPVAMAAVRRDVFSLQAAAEELRCNEDFMIQAICEEPMAFLFATENLQQDKDFVVRAVKQNMRVLRYVGKLQQDAAVMSAATNTSGKAMHLAWEDEETIGTGWVSS
eukprot:symbB.v1.2.025256.t1/scaffold2395.1/size82271/4